jgi:HTH-type transcriptional regulator, sugar sensing transcriptional regulator
MKNQAAAALTFLGFSEIEALIYTFLLQESPATGYRVSHAIGKPTANTYKAIAALALRGAIIIDDSDNRLCRAVPPGELLDRLGRAFDTHKKTAADELAKIKQAAGDDRVYYLTSVEQVIERARAMLAQAKQAALLDLFPKCVPRLSADLESAARRGVKVAARCYEPTGIKGVTVVTTRTSERVLGTWPGQQLSVATDGDQFLHALLSQDVSSVHQALWSNSTLMSCLQYNALYSEIMSAEAENAGRGVASPLSALSLTTLKPLGFRKLNERYGEAAPKRRRS